VKYRPSSNPTVKINGNRGTQQEISVSTKVSKEIVPFEHEFPIYNCDVKNDPIGHPESDKKSTSDYQFCKESDSTQKPPTPYDSGSAILVKRSIVSRPIEACFRRCCPTTGQFFVVQTGLYKV